MSVGEQFFNPPRKAFIRESWDLPRILVIGNGNYALTFAQILGASLLDPNQLLRKPAEIENSSLPMVFGDLERVVLVEGNRRSAAHLLIIYQTFWRWIEKLSPKGDQHDLSFLIILSESQGYVYERALALGLGLDSVDPETSGHGVVRFSDSLEYIFKTLLSIRPMDLPSLRGRIKMDARHNAVRALRLAHTPESLKTAAKEIQSVFLEQEFNLDLFCKPPNHRNGNKLRQLLWQIQTTDLTPKTANNISNEISHILKSE